MKDQTHDYLLDASDAVTALVDGTTDRVELSDGSSVRGRLRGLIPMLTVDASEASPSGGGGGGGFEYKTPLHMPSFQMLLTIQSEARDIASLVGAPRRPKSGDTLRGIIGVLGSKDESVQRSVAMRLTSLVSQARLVLNLDRAPIRLHYVRCPYCGCASILAARSEALAWCTTRDCVDSEGRRYTWSGEVSLRLLGASQESSVAEAITA